MAKIAADFAVLTEEIYAAFNAHDIEKFLSFHADDVTVENVAEGMIIHGRDELRSYISGYFAAFADFRMNLESSFAFGMQQFEECTTSGTHTGGFHGIPAGRKHLSMRVALVREFRDGMTVRVRQYYDSASLVRQLGGAPRQEESAPLLELRVANEQFLKGINSLDADVIASMIHPEAVNFLRDSAFAGEVPRGVSAETYRAVVRNSFEGFESMQETPVNLQYKVVGNTGIVWGYNTIVTRLKGGLVQTKQSRITTTWIKSDGKWLVLCAHLSAIPSGD